jgi:hypothetical protein
MKFRCSYHLGDQMFTLWYLNLAAKQFPEVEFSFYVPWEYYREISPLAAQFSNLTVTAMPSEGMLDCWIGQDGWYSRRNPNRFVDFLMEFHAHLAAKHGLGQWKVFPREAMLLPAANMVSEHALKDQSFDLLFVNSVAMSNQCPGYNRDDLDQLAKECALNGIRTVVTHPCGMDLPTTTTLGLRLNQLGELASRCRVVAGVANAPFLATFNELAFPKVEWWLNYSIDRVNFDESRVIPILSIRELRDGIVAKLL